MGLRRRRIQLINEVDRVPHTVIFVAQRGPYFATVWSPVGQVQGTKIASIVVLILHLSMPTDMAQLLAICRQSEAKRDGNANISA